MKAFVSVVRMELSIGDPVNEVFIQGERVVRLIGHDYEGKIERLFSSGLVGRLTEQKLLHPATLRMESGRLLVEQALIPCVTYPAEWSFSMLQDAALLTLRINEEAEKFGYQTKDCHAHNIVFFGNRPVWVDIGSFIELASIVPRGRLLTQQEFQQSYVIPLRSWARLGDELGARLLPTASGLVTADAYVRLLTFSLPRLLAQPLLFFKRIADSLGNVFAYLNDRSTKSSRKLKIATTINRLRLDVPFNNRAGLLRKVTRATPPAPRSAWAHYHSDFTAEPSGLPSKRFLALSEVIRRLGVKSLVDLAGNQGGFSKLLLSSTQAERVVCIDYDRQAIDIGYQSSRDTRGLTFAVINPFNPSTAPQERPAPERFRSEAVLALALTHHLLLNQKYDVAHVMRTIAAYCSAYALIEFMPLGLWSSVAPDVYPELPRWYTDSWFQDSLSVCFVIEERIETERNRVLYVCRKRASAH
jgi:hypothetical protein